MPEIIKPSKEVLAKAFDKLDPATKELFMTWSPAIITLTGAGVVLHAFAHQFSINPRLAILEFLGGCAIAHTGRQLFVRQ